MYNTLLKAESSGGFAGGCFTSFYQTGPEQLLPSVIFHLSEIRLQCCQLMVEKQQTSLFPVTLYSWEKRFVDLQSTFLSASSR